MNIKKPVVPILVICFMMFVVACGSGQPSDSAKEPAVSDTPPKAAAEQPAKQPVEQPTPKVAAKPQWKPTDKGEILIVDANVQECFPQDMNVKDMINFVDRLSKILPNRPDILLLQEVLKGSAEEVAQFLSEATGETYKVVVSPEKNLTIGKDPKLPGEIRRDTAILVRSGVFEATDSGGFIRSSYTLEEAVENETKYANSKDHAYGLVKDTRDGTSLALASVHLHTGNFYKTAEIFTKKAQWTSEVAKFMDEKYPEDDNTIHVIAGDFNNRHNMPGSDESYPFWKVLTEQFHYKDTVYEKGGPGEIRKPDTTRIDFIFEKGGNIHKAGSDLKYTTQRSIREDKNQHYSDHRFHWAILGTKG